jgi:hypothetical protein
MTVKSNHNLLPKHNAAGTKESEENCLQIRRLLEFDPGTFQLRASHATATQLRGSKTASSSAVQEHIRALWHGLPETLHNFRDDQMILCDCNLFQDLSLRSDVAMHLSQPCLSYQSRHELPTTASFPVFPFYSFNVFYNTRTQNNSTLDHIHVFKMR